MPDTRKSLTVRLTPDVYKAIKLHVIETDETLQTYITRLVLQDLSLNINKESDRFDRAEQG